MFHRKLERFKRIRSVFSSNVAEPSVFGRLWALTSAPDPASAHAPAPDPAPDGKVTFRIYFYFINFKTSPKYLQFCFAWKILQKNTLIKEFYLNLQR